MASTLFLDPVTGEHIAYEDLLASLVGATVGHAPRLRPATPGGAVLGLLRAVVLGQAITLFDSDFSDEELSLWGEDVGTVGECRMVPGLPPGDFERIVEQARHTQGFRLTLFTSGSTGRPKRVTHGLEGLTRALRVGPRHEASVWGLAYNPTHIAGVQVILQAFFNRNPLIHLFQATPETVARAIQEHRITHLSATPSFFRLLLSSGAMFETLRSVSLGGERSDGALLAALRGMFPTARLRNLYASTEAGTLLEASGEFFSVPEGLRDRVRVWDGQLEVHASLLGDFGDGASGAEVWYRTGDRVELCPDDSSRFRILSREGDWVNVGGHKVDLGEVETEMLGFPGVREVRVYGRPNSVLGQILCAEVVADDSFDEAELREVLAQRLQPVKVPRLIKRVPFLERTRSGKISRR